MSVASHTARGEACRRRGVYATTIIQASMNQDFYVMAFVHRTCVACISDRVFVWFEQGSALSLRTTSAAHMLELFLASAEA